MIAAHLKNLLIADKRDKITLVHHADVTFHAAAAIGHHVGFDGVIAGIRITKNRNGALEQNAVERFGEHFAAVHFAHFPFEPRARPSQRWVGEFYAIGFVIHRELEALEILRVRNLRQNAPAQQSAQPARSSLERAGAANVVQVRRDGVVAHTGVHAGFDFGGGRDEFRELRRHVAFHHIAVGVDGVDGELDRLTRFQ